MPPYLPPAVIHWTTACDFRPLGTTLARNIGGNAQDARTRCRALQSGCVTMLDFRWLRDSARPLSGRAGIGSCQTQERPSCSEKNPASADRRCGPALACHRGCTEKSRGRFAAAHHQRFIITGCLLRCHPQHQQLRHGAVLQHGKAGNDLGPSGLALEECLDPGRLGFDNAQITRATLLCTMLAPRRGIQTR